MLASLERLQAESGHAKAREELASVESFLANAHRLIRTSLSLEAGLRDECSLPRLPELTEFAAQLDRCLAAIDATLRDDTPLQADSPRPAERRLAASLEQDPVPENPLAGLALADTCDRLAGGVDTLAHLLRCGRPRTSQAAVAVAG